MARTGRDSVRQARSPLPTLHIEIGWAYMKALRNHANNRRDEIEEFKQFLGPAGAGYTGAQLPQLRREMHAMAELLLDIYLYKTTPKHGGNSPKAFDN